MTYELQLVPDAEALHRVAAEQFVHHARRAVHEAGRFTVALSGGSTPSAMYALLALDQAMLRQVPWGKVHFFWGDERHVPPDHADSNYRMARAQLLSRVPVPEVNVRRIRGEQRDAELIAQRYEHTLQAFFQLPPPAAAALRSGTARSGRRRAHRIVVPRDRGGERKPASCRGQLGR
jgi:6-phosphogluconolactonase